MSEEEDLIGQESEAVEPEEVQEVEESATPEIEEASQEEAEADGGTPNGDGYQKRVNKITREKHEQRERAERAERELEQLRSNQPQAQPVGQAPREEDFEDYSLYEEAVMEHKIDQRFQAQEQRQQQQNQDQQKEARNASFNKQVEEMGIADYAEVIEGLPRDLVKNGSVDVIMEAGPKVAYFLGTHLDIADDIADMSPIQAALRIGQISAQLNGSKQTKKTTKAPPPVQTLKGGSGSSTKTLENMSMEEAYERYS